MTNTLDIKKIQLPLEMQLKNGATFACYYAGSNSQTLDKLKAMAHGLGEQFIYLYGKSGVGLTHLLHAACHEATSSNETAICLSLSKLSEQSLAIFEGVEYLSLVAIDDVQTIAGNIVWEQALLELFCLIRAKQSRLIIGSHKAIQELNFLSLDLKKHLQWGIELELLELNKEERLLAVQKHAMQRGLQLNKWVAEYLLNHYADNMTKLCDTLEKLDQASMAEQRRLTIPFIKQVLRSS